MKWYIPREHGAWAMLIVPYWTGAMISGFHWYHLLFFVGLFAIYFAQAPLLTYIRNKKHTDVWPSFSIYLAVGTLFILPFLFHNPGLFWIGLCIFPLFLLNIYFAKTKRERLFLNDFIAIVALSSLLLLAYRITEPALTSEAFLFLFINVLFFTASVFHVKSLIREKKNKQFHRQSLIYHIVIVLISFAMNWIGAGIAFIFTLLKTALLPKKYFARPIQIGVIEIINSALFFVIVITVYFVS
ncbi:YwiC-like protein [Evansella caseinilytica]|uniref:YwiC-like protein n=1 Tax=Evansella caseinilytica TaxID=1503961 RepID=A0A1H3PK10_9BACI|nr:YwiC-like family protein [Evansella caseinilytica]SDZ01436.1 YwiC-like protein [Evansella caseinilytica]